MVTDWQGEEAENILEIFNWSGGASQVVGTLYVEFVVRYVGGLSMRNGP